jgi:hypothetical protein
VYVRCNASGQTIWRHLRRNLASDLLSAKNDYGSSRLQALVTASPPTTAGHLGVQRALEAFAKGLHTRAAEAWLRGEPLSEADMSALRIGTEKDDEETSRETDAKLAVEALLRFLSPAPVVICFDQVEGLETYPGDQTGYHSMGQMISALVNGEHRKLLLVSCIVTAYEQNLDRLPNGADRDRWVQDKATLPPIEWDAAVDLIRLRLDNAASLRAGRAKHPGNAFWPLDEEPLRALFASTGRCLPRTLIQKCRVEFDRTMTGDDLDQPPPPPVISEPDFLQQEYHKLLSKARLEWRKAGGEKVLGEGLPWLLQNSGWTVLGRRPGQVNFADLVCRTTHREANFLFRYSGGVGFTNLLRKALQEWHAPASLYLLSDPAVQPKPASKGAAYLTQLKDRGARQIHPLPEALAALYAIRDLITAVRAGELNRNGATVSEDAAATWILQNLAPELEALRDDIVGATPEDPLKTKLLNLLNRHKLMDADAAAKELSSSSEEIASCARRNPMHFGLLEGPPVVLFEPVEGSSENATHA